MVYLKPSQITTQVTWDEIPAHKFGIPAQLTEKIRTRKAWRAIAPAKLFLYYSCEGTLLGAPLLDGSAMNQALEARCTELNRALDRFPLISAHDGLVILKNSISTPKLKYTLRCSPAFGHSLLDGYDRNLRLGLSRLANVHVDDLNWVQASLPVKDGGLGIRSVGLLAPSAFLASAAATHDLQAQLLPAGCLCDP